MKHFINEFILNFVTPLKTLFRRFSDFFSSDLRRILRSYEKHDGELSTCAIAFFLLISFIPASLVIISIMSFFYESDDMALYYFHKVSEFLPAIKIDEFVRIIDRIVFSKRYLALVWVPFLFWWASLVFDIIERALQKAFRIEKSRKYWKAKIRHFFIIAGIGFLMLGLTLFSNLAAIIQNSEIHLFLEKNLIGLEVLRQAADSIADIPFFVASTTSMAINTVLFFVIYRFVPLAKLDHTSVFKGALFASFSYEVVKIFFSFYISEINDYTSIFGSLSTIVILMIWIWYTSFLLVIGAEAAWVFYDRKNPSRRRAVQFPRSPFGEI